MNRTTIRCRGSDIRIDINGTEILRAKDARYPSGTVALGATTWSSPVVVKFDNLLVTTSSHW